MFLLPASAYRARTRVVPIRPLLDRRGGGYQRFDSRVSGRGREESSLSGQLGQIFPGGIRITYQFIAKSR
jgi:hypothetical protein